MAKKSNFISMNFSGALLLAFIILKLTHVIDWSWWWVLSPLWLPLAVIIGIALIVGAISLVIKA